MENKHGNFVYHARTTYPERLGLAVCYDPPSVFSVFWKLISPFIDVKTKSKIRFVQPRGTRRRKPLKKMDEMFHPNAIDSDMGGSRYVEPIDEYQSLFANATRSREACLVSLLRKRSRVIARARRFFIYTRTIYISVSSSCSFLF